MVLLTSLIMGSDGDIQESDGGLLCHFRRLTALVDESMSSIQGELTPSFFHLEKFGKY